MTESSAVPVPGKEHYGASYWEHGRIHSFAHAIEAIRVSGAQSVLDVGVGNGFVSRAIELLGIEVRVLDLNPELAPDLVGSVTELPFRSDSFDLVSCCQVLEHLPFDDAGKGLKELIRVARRTVLVSVPDITRCVELGIRLPRIGRRLFQVSIPHWPNPEISPSRVAKLGHSWEIGYKGTPLPAFISLISNAGGTVECRWRVSELPWHHFFIIKKGE